MKRKVISTVIAACMVVGTMASFGTSVNAATSKLEDSGEKVTLKLFHNQINVDEAPYFEEFESTHPNVDIVVENVGDPDYKSKLKVMLGADNAPDIFFSWSPRVLMNAGLSNLSRFYSTLPEEEFSNRD